VRFLAALTVFVAHVSLRRLTGGFLWQLRDAGDEAVVVFFVLSGFVIAFVTSGREGDVKTYAVNRLARIMSVAVPALILTFCLDAVGKSLRPDLYAGWGQEGYTVIWQYISGLLFLNELWYSHVPQGSDLPYWSLGFEVWYYLVFGLAFFTPGKWKYAAVAVAALIAGPKIMALFPLWLIGYGCYGLTARIGSKPVLGFVLFFGSFAGWIGYEVWAARYGRLFGVAPAFVDRTEFAQDYLIGGLFAANMVGFAMWSRAGLLDRPARVIRWLAGGTFSLYLFHYPIMHFLAAMLSWPADAWRTRAAIIVGTLVGTFLLAEVSEHRKELWRAWIVRCWNHLAVAPVAR
jgi:peptidoglycan/LPS O-acetylase OafA/YrhL